MTSEHSQAARAGRAAGFLGAGASPPRHGRNIGWSLGGQAVSMAAVLALTPLQIAGMGRERYGLLVLMAATVGYLSFVDIGAAWAITRHLPILKARGEVDRSGELVATGLVTTVVLGGAAGGALWCLAPWLATGALRVSPSLTADAELVVRAAAVAGPLLLVQGVFTGVLRAHGLFRALAVLGAVEVVTVNVVWAVVAGSDGAVPAVAAAQVALVGLLTVARVAILGAAGAWPPGRFRPSGRALRETAAFGALTTVSRLGTVAASSLDKLVLGSVVPARQLVLYAIPYSLAQRITIVCSASVSVLFPSFSEAVGAGRPDDGRAEWASRQVALLTGALGAVLFAAGPAFVTVWIGGDFGREAAFEIRVLSLGYALTAAGSLERVFAEASGRARAPAVLTLVAGAGGLLLLVPLARRFGTDGAAAAMGLALAVTGLGDIGVAAQVRARPFAARARRLLGPWPVIYGAAAASAALAGAVSGPVTAVVAATTAAAAATAPWWRRP